MRAVLLHRDERGEGVISTGIAVLIMALIGAAMWIAFSNIFGEAAENVGSNVDCLATNSCTTDLSVPGSGG